MKTVCETVYAVPHLIEILQFTTQLRTRLTPPAAKTSPISKTNHCNDLPCHSLILLSSNTDLFLKYNSVITMTFSGNNKSFYLNYTLIICSMIVIKGVK
jgi:hypothetical protein